VVEIGAAIVVGVRMPVEKRRDHRTMPSAGLIVSSKAREQVVIAPRSPVRARLPKQLSFRPVFGAAKIPGEKQKPPAVAPEPHLRISHLLIGDAFKRGDVIRL